MNEMINKVAGLWPEMVLLLGASACLITGLAPQADTRRTTPWIAAGSLLIAGLLVPFAPAADHSMGLGGITSFIKLAVTTVGLILLMVASGVPEQLEQNQTATPGHRFDPGDYMGGEFYAFLLLSLTGAMLASGADDLVWLFLALELTSLPTYVMVVTGRNRIAASESAVKYFFLGALSAAIFLYGFALIYGATGFTDFRSIHNEVQQQLVRTQALSPLLLMGLVLSIAGICFKIAAVPMHFYAADVYEGAHSSVTALLAFVPKAAGFIALILLLKLLDWPLNKTPGWDSGDVVVTLIWVMAVLTMTIGNVLGLLQQNVKRVLAYSSIAHSGYLLVGLLAGPVVAAETSSLGDGLAAILFYLVAYGLGTIGSFAVIGCLQTRGEEAQTFADLTGLSKRQPMLAAIMLISVLSLLGLPPLVGFLGKIYLFGAAYTAGFVWLVVIAVLNSAISAAYYLRIVAVCYIGDPDETVEPVPAPGRRAGAIIAAIAVITLGLAGGKLVDSARTATAQEQPITVVPDLSKTKHTSQAPTSNK